MVPRKSIAFWVPLTALLFADCTTKRYAIERLEGPLVPHDVLGDVLRFTLAYNPGAAFSLSVGEHSRWIFSGIAVVMIAILARMYQSTPSDDRLRAAALALIAGGALGNLMDRLRSPHGVVDFIDIGLGDLRFWTFNLADVGVTSGAVLLALLLLRTASDPVSAGSAGSGDASSDKRSAAGAA